ncbi:MULTISPECIES: hypothetical protein [Pedobacter]|uniref:hypothetical protein n=1 Tax=Pedobacter TaxID=84567 RepID=UPI000649B55C|nr:MULTISPECIES: hypothetical protein [Pedobacter]KLT64761.1 hypothetical protein AB669_13540 [Pedobacter sp. BMA]
MKKVNLLSKAEMKNVMGGLADTSDRGCIVYEINGDTRTIVAYVNEGGNVNAGDVAASHASYTGNRTGWDCPSDGWQHEYV